MQFDEIDKFTEKRPSRYWIYIIIVGKIIPLYYLSTLAAEHVHDKKFLSTRDHLRQIINSKN